MQTAEFGGRYSQDTQTYLNLNNQHNFICATFVHFAGHQRSICFEKMAYVPGKEVQTSLVQILAASRCSGSL